MDRDTLMSEAEVTRNCTNCAFAFQTSLPPPNIGKIHECKFFPPQVVVMPSHSGAQVVTMFPPVNEKMICQQHHLRDEIENAPSRVVSG